VGVENLFEHYAEVQAERTLLSNLNQNYSHRFGSIKTIAVAIRPMIGIGKNIEYCKIKITLKFEYEVITSKF
jgi:hypothetical protein